MIVVTLKVSTTLTKKANRHIFNINLTLLKPDNGEVDSNNIYSVEYYHYAITSFFVSKNTPAFMPTTKGLQIKNINSHSLCNTMAHDHKVVRQAHLFVWILTVN